ncbi:hypothetical protein COT82_00380 [Candidatus Campbellbacteria bacterium CG10_big_fil_rev_8_21_14_0_10_35_52]|uniref:Transcription regulator TrmB N-terminal domain-containing protein n=1 Tax=Candidatus Campbellbacteria bacterium CG10_big_fil_rev_8_21_14_0_10_35_52 TaxID=1974527 RepID=A0A2M6WVX9_9BACT|nr:MAG: hypothetical protein COT82_00380 [Candidatus Campbellbacteria bacterium CG10_big_fil_rev_8_21_14_0_10_35_52]
MIKQLQQLGFSDKEAVVYMAFLELGSSAVQEIAKKAEIKYVFPPEFV